MTSLAGKPTVDSPAAQRLARSSRWRRGRDGALWPLVVALFLLLLISCAALGPLLRGTAWWWSCAAVAFAVLFGAAIFRRLGLSRPIIPVANVVVLIGAMTLLFGGGTALFWVIPTPQTVGTFAGLIDAGSASIAQQSTPAEVTLGILFLLAGGTGLIAIVMDLLAVTLRWPALAAAGALVPLLAPGFIIRDGAETITLTAAAIALLLVLWVDVHVRRAQWATRASAGASSPSISPPQRARGLGPIRGALPVGSLTIVGALILSSVAPSFTAGGLVTERASGLLFGTGVSPMINLGQDLRRPEAGPAFHYTSTGTEPPYFSLLTLDDVVGKTWTARIDGADTRNTVDNIRRPLGLDPTVETVEASTSVVIDGVKSHWLPAPARATSVEGLNGRWYWDSGTRAIASTTANTLGQEYTVSSLEVAPTADQLRQSGSDYPASVLSNLQLPVEPPPIIEETARTVTAGTSSNYDAAVAVQNYLRSAAFTYDTEAPVEDGYDGGGVDVIGVFLEVKRGYCVHFAATMATMARALGIPSRVSLGYLPGVRSQDLVQGRGRYDVDSHDLHAWPELYFVGVGWVKFEPTPGRGTVPDFERSVDAGTPATLPGGAAATGAPGLGPDRLVDDTALDSGAATQNGTTSNALPLIGFSALALVLLLLPGLARGMLRRSRVRRIRSGAAGGDLAWIELEHTSLDHGMPVPITDTPRTFAGRIKTRVTLDPASSAALERVLLAVERTRFDRSEVRTETLADDLTLVLRAVHASASVARRMRAVFAPASLLTGLGAVLRGERRARTVAP
jgi:transglutaminase-like putative cysteine protease